MACCNDSFDAYMSKYLGSLNEDNLDEIFERYDKDGNGFIDASELEGFLQGISKKKLTANEVQELKIKILEIADKNNDEKLDKKELRSILPTEENFLLQLPSIGKNICGVDFIKIWNHYDKNGNQILDGSELNAFFKDLILRGYPTIPRDFLDAKIESFRNSVLNNFNKDGKNENGISKADLFELLNVEVICPEFEGDCSKDFDEIFSKYDKDNSGTIDENELGKFLSALHLNSEEEVASEIQEVILAKFCKNDEKVIKKSDLKEYLRIKDVN